MNEATWAALTIILTVLGGAWTWLAFRRRGAVNGLRALGFTLFPAAAWLTGTLETITEIAASVTDWATSLVFSPSTWTGIGLAGLGLVLILTSGLLRDRALGRAQGRGASQPRVGKTAPDTTRLPRGSSAAETDDDMSDIEALLKKRGIE